MEITENVRVTVFCKQLQAMSFRFAVCASEHCSGLPYNGQCAERRFIRKSIYIGSSPCSNMVLSSERATSRNGMRLELRSQTNLNQRDSYTVNKVLVFV